MHHLALVGWFSTLAKKKACVNTSSTKGFCSFPAAEVGERVGAWACVQAGF